MNRLEGRRREIIESGSPLANHSLNQRRMKHETDGEKRLAPDKKAMRAQARAERKRNRKLAIEIFPSTTPVIEIAAAAE